MIYHSNDSGEEKPKYPGLSVMVKKADSQNMVYDKKMNQVATMKMVLLFNLRSFFLARLPSTIMNMIQVMLAFQIFYFR